MSEENESALSVIRKISAIANAEQEGATSKSSAETYRIWKSRQDVAKP